VAGSGLERPGKRQNVSVGQRKTDLYLNDVRGKDGGGGKWIEMIRVGLDDEVPVWRSMAFGVLSVPGGGSGKPFAEA